MRTGFRVEMAKLSFLNGMDRENGSVDLNVCVSGAIAEDLLSALMAPSLQAVKLAESALASSYHDRLAKASASVAAAVHGEDGGLTSEAAAFALGQISMAHSIVSTAASKLVSKGFERRVRSRWYAPIVQLLGADDLSDVEIADRIGCTERGVSRRMKVLRAIGAVECRRDGRRMVNFLTMAALSVHCGPDRLGLAIFAVRSRLDEHRRVLPKFMRSQMTF